MRLNLRPPFIKLLALLTLLASCPALAEWPIKHFQVFVGKPAKNTFKLGISGEDIIRLGDGYVEVDTRIEPPTPITAGLIREIESYLNETATRLEAMGFPPPKLEPVVELADGSRAYRVYLYDFDKLSSTAAYRYDCSGDLRPLIEINSANYAGDGKTLSDKGYQDLPHELFHAVQKSYPLFNKNCNLGDWIVEGTAQAIGADMAAWSARRMNHPNRTGQWLRDRWGYRAYDSPLWVPDDSDPVYKRSYSKNNGYGASSFWRYLGEYARTGGAAGTETVKPDYRYLTDFFASEVAPGDRESAEMDWLNDNLLTHPKFKTGLHRLYPYFITTYASYLPHRFKPAGASPSTASEKWLKLLFPALKCPEIRISEANPVYRGRMTVRANAATCYRLNLGFYQPMDIHIEIAGIEVKQLRALSMGTEQGAVVAQPLLKKQLDGSWTGSRILNISDPMSTPQPILIISNVDQHPANTRSLTADIEIAASTFDHSMLPPQAKPAAKKKAPSPSSGTTGTTGGSLTTAQQANRVGQELDKGMESLNPNLANSSSVIWNKREHPCTNAFVTTVCGPHTVIRLTAVPGMFASVEQTTGRGGEFGQFLNMMGGIGTMGPMQAGDKYAQALEKADQLDGVDVIISIPLIDYGYSGTFGNASIVVSKRGGGHYQAIGPQDIQPGPGAQYPLSGKVTIDEFTPSVMRGSFVGTMVDPDSKATVSEDASLPVAHTVSGRFQIVGTWQEDDRIHRETSEDLQTSVRTDVAAASSAQGAIGTHGAGAGEPGAAETGPAGGASGGQLNAVCDCSCNTMESAVPECETQCAGTFRACLGQMATALSLAENAFKPTELEADASEPFLRTIPDACELMDAHTLASALAVPKVTAKGPHEWIPQALSQCGYIAPGHKGTKIELKMMFQPLDLYNSREHSVDDLTLRAIGFGSVDATEVHKQPGNIAIITHAANTSNLVVLTGIYGFGWESEEFASELVLTYSLTLPSHTTEQRSQQLLELARPHVERLQKLAVSTHEGG